MIYESRGSGFDSNAPAKKPATSVQVSADLSLIAAGGKTAVLEAKDELTNEEGNMAYTGMPGKAGFSNKNNKIVKKFAALPPPGHAQWNNIPGNENWDDEGLDNTPIIEGIDNSYAHIVPVGQNFKPDKRGVKVCTMWKRGLCKFGDRCIYNHGEVMRKTQLQAVVDANIAPDEKDIFGYRIAPGRLGKTASGGGLVPGPDGKMAWKDETTSAAEKVPKPPKLDDTTDWYNSGSKELDLKSADRNVIQRSIEEAKKIVGMLETDFTNAPKPKKAKWD